MCCCSSRERRYRLWAKDAGDAAEGLRACAAREDEIATRVERLLPADASGLAAIDRVVPRARELYYGLFDGMGLREQLALQAAAERQGAAAWRGLAAGHDDPAVRDALEACARLEEESADHLDALLAQPGALPD